MLEFNVRKKVSSRINRLKFLKECIAEQVLPASVPTQLKQNNKPFSKAAKAYMEEICQDLRDDLNALLGERKGITLPQELVMKLKKINEDQQKNLEKKLLHLCANSPWKQAGNPDIVRNVSSRQLSNTEIEALSLGMKFDSGKDKMSFVEHVNKNYKWDDPDVEKGFAQGVLACCKALADEESNSMPRRYAKALKTLANDKSIVITQADKGGGLVIIDRAEYRQKMQDMLSNQDTYQKGSKGSIEKASQTFNKSARRILKKSDRGKRMLHLIEEAPKAPTMRGLPKIHKAGRPMRPITSGVGSAPHCIAKVLAKPLTRMLDTISGCHIKNTSDMVDRLKGKDFSDHMLASLDVQSLFTNVAVDGALRVIKDVVGTMDEEELPLPQQDYIDIVTLCMRFNVFNFEDEEYSQHNGLAMGSPLSPVAACLYLEKLEEEHYLGIMGPDTMWMRYIDDVLIVIPKDIDIEQKVQRLNTVDANIQFTLEKEAGGGLPFLDTFIGREGQNLKYRVYRKPSCKEDYIHYYSGHNERYKRGVVIGFFLRAYRVCSPEYLQEEIEHIFKRFQQLKYPKGLLMTLKKKAQKIRERATDDTTRNARQNARREEKSRTLICIPNFQDVDVIARYLDKAGFRTVIGTGEKSGDILKYKCSGNRTCNEKSVVYRIPCGTCDRSYIGESGRGLKTRIAEHRRDVRGHVLSNAIVVHADKSGHLPRWEQAEILEKGMKKNIRRALEAAHIKTKRTYNTRPGFYTLGQATAELALA